MGQSYRIRTELGVNQTIQVQLDQEFEFLEILSLQLQQEDIFIRACSDYGVIVGRVTANNGLGIPNARVSVFVPIEVLDESNPVIQSIYPYKSPTDKNEDGYRYNLLPYAQSHSGHSPTGTLPTRLDVLTGKTVTEIFDKYYKFTAKTNESGDYMIMGVPVGEQNLVMDVDLSDIGEFSLTPQDLIRMGRATEAQVAGNRFRTSTDLNSLPQIVNLTKTIEVSPLWGEPSICQVAINRLDFDLRDDANIDIQPTSVFMGSIFSSSDSYRLRGTNGRIKDDLGNLCQLQAGPGQILAIRQTIFQDTNGNPILEQYKLEQNGNVIDGNGAWLVELPMNLDYFVTNEFGERVLSYDPTIGVPTKAKYRFKIKWQQSSDLTEQTRRPYYLVPNVREFGWDSASSTDINVSGGGNQDQLQSSYYFGLDWTGYTKGFTTTQANTKLNQIINCEDTFYQFDFNRVYTVSSLIDQYKYGGRGRFIGIKEVTSPDCSETVNKFPVNEGFKNFDLIYFLFSFLMTILQIIGLPLIFTYHLVAFLWNNFAVVLVGLLLAFVGQAIYQTVQEFIAFVASAVGFSFSVIIGAGAILLRLGFYTALQIGLIKNFKKLIKLKFPPLKFPMVQYPSCQSCQCNNGEISPDTSDNTIPAEGIITQTSNSEKYSSYMNGYFSTRTGMAPQNDNYEAALSALVQTRSQSLGSNPSNQKNPTRFKTTKSLVLPRPNDAGETTDTASLTFDLPIGERINTFNLRKKYFDNFNKIKVTFNSPTNFTQNSQLFHYDNTLTVLSPQAIEAGTLLTFINPNSSTDVNYLFTAATQNGVVYNGIWGKTPTTTRQIPVSYAQTQTTNATPVIYNIPFNNFTGATPNFTDSITLKLEAPGTISYTTCTGNTVVDETYTADTGNYPLNITLTNSICINVDSLAGTASYSIVGFGNECRNYSYPSDIEYYQVLTAITITSRLVNNVPVYSVPGLAPVNANNQTLNPSFWNFLTSNSRIISWDWCSRQKYWNTNPTSTDSTVWYEDFNATALNEFSQQNILILQRGVDPYSPLLINRYGIGKILGHASEDAVVITAQTRLNVPIQAIPTSSNLTVQNHSIQSQIQFQSNFFTPGFAGNTNPPFSPRPYTTSRVGFYGALDSRNSQITSQFGTFYSNNYVNVINNGVFSNNFTNYFNPRPQSQGGVWPPNFYIGNIYTKYDNSDDLSGGAVLWGTLFERETNNPSPPGCRGRYRGTSYDTSAEAWWVNGWAMQVYFSPNLYPTFTGTPLSVNSISLNVMRTDRLPSSDVADNGGDWNGSVSLLQQNLGFQVYNLGAGEGIRGQQFSTGAQTITADIEGQYAAINVFSSLDTCDKMVGLTCYSGNGVSFGVKDGCQGTDTVDNGCYVMVKRPLIDLFNGKDYATWSEWGYRYRFFYALCRGVLSQSFTNNWVNGSLFMFPIQVDRYFDRNNKPLPPSYPKRVVYFDKDTNNFYFRSSPYWNLNSRFVGSPADTRAPQNSVNSRNLLFPTTIMNLGMKDSFYDELIFEPSTASYVMDRLNPTSYSDTSDITNLFVISRITDGTFLGRMFALGDNGINQLFSRFGTTLFIQPKARVDADFAQLISINSEVGLIPFSPEFYPVGGQNDPVIVLGNPKAPTMGIFYSSTTFNLQDKDFLSPGIINFRPNPNNTAITFEYGIKTQVVPFYRWQIYQPAPSTDPLIPSNPNIFGTERNNWETRLTNFPSLGYQSLSRRRIPDPHYFTPSNTTLDIYQRGYIFDVDANGNFSYTATTSSPNEYIVVGAPYHFYFGLIKGESALDKFKTKYGINE